jgi:hypothetical protein
MPRMEPEIRAPIEQCTAIKLALSDFGLLRANSGFYAYNVVGE